MTRSGPAATATRTAAPVQSLGRSGARAQPPSALHVEPPLAERRFPAPTASCPANLNGGRERASAGLRTGSSNDLCRSSRVLGGASPRVRTRLALESQYLGLFYRNDGRWRTGPTQRRDVGVDRHRVQSRCCRHCPDRRVLSFLKSATARSSHRATSNLMCFTRCYPHCFSLSWHRSRIREMADSKESSLVARPLYRPPTLPVSQPIESLRGHLFLATRAGSTVRSNRGRKRRSVDSHGKLTVHSLEP